jgi:hypothetical protein
MHMLMHGNLLGARVGYAKNKVGLLRDIFLLIQKAVVRKEWRYAKESS